MILVRPASSYDWHALGVLVQEAIFEAPSSPVGFEELPLDPTTVGEEIARIGDPEMAACLLADVGIYLGGVCQVLWGEFGRCRHSVQAFILVHPDARRKGVASELLQTTVERLQNHPAVEKVTLQVADCDAALKQLLHDKGWRLERRAIGALWTRRAPVDVLHYALDVTSPPPASRQGERET